MQKFKRDHLFPDSIDFYGKGQVKSESPEKFQGSGLPETNPVIVTRLIDSDFLGLPDSATASAGTCLFQFSELPQNRSMALEIANILASQLAHKVSQEIGANVIVRPSQLSTLRYDESALQTQGSRVYSYQSEHETFFIRMLFIAAVAGNA
ncbi:MAG TPA: hypothetical protein PLH57_05595 [Oligoflexia bacterium]|nr:hypothetical protein [Oligoflexia bacterium]